VVHSNCLGHVVEAQRGQAVEDHDRLPVGGVEGSAADPWLWEACSWADIPGGLDWHSGAQSWLV